MNIDSIEISKATPFSADVSTVAQWLSDNWGVDMGYSLSETEDWCNELAGEVSETLIIGKFENHIVGTIIVCECDLEGYEHLTPWISGLFVPNDYRGIGIGGLFIKAASEWALKQRFTELFLYADEGRLIPYYKGFGWEVAEDVRIDGEKFQIMRKLLTTNSDLYWQRDFSVR